MKQIALVAILAGSVLMTFPAAAADVNVCGTLRTLNPPTQTINEGTATVGDKLWRLSGTPGPNNLSPQATVGSNVCLSGDRAVSQTAEDLLIRWSLVPNTAQSPTPPTSAPATSAPAASTSAVSTPSTALPSTITTTSESDGSLPLVVGALIAAAVLALLLIGRTVARRQRGA
jgi:hypothetical protein